MIFDFESNRQRRTEPNDDVEKEEIEEDKRNQQKINTKYIREQCHIVSDCVVVLKEVKHLKMMST